MPRFNQKGPEGKGSMTGRGLGPCNKENSNNESLNKEAEGSNFYGSRGRRCSGNRARRHGRGQGRNCVF
ncbi:MAG: DUF5320 domain-containing protein [Pleomorphochaeta sp.]